ncbi:GNAT family N-acetyltransferase [Desulfosporosinus sp.]|uniref:GNAT family N-acetyltransferase n=1 Tax=Desulfosporosinus sp. TaxID=157907 RepID=UPI0025C193E0|nr:GNAT family N-acetyltransferase [Desulfosporosinus sp.]MBC2724900.1 GNAT family N-acetyltransferase [Desulfosporosinus sp.]
MSIRACKDLSGKDYEEVLNLETICIDHDNLSGSFFLDPSLNFDSRIKSFFLLYEKSKLISMLSMFIPTNHEAEITAYTLPKFRGKGYFKSLLGRAVEELRQFHVTDLLFVCESTSIPGKRVIRALKADYDHTEYFMRLNKSRYTPLDTYRLMLLEAGQKDLERAITVNMRVFEDSYEESKSLIQNCFQSDIRKQYLAVLKDLIIGLGSANFAGEDVSIYGVGILPEFRFKGYGKELVHLIVDSVWQSGNSEITIEVHSENDNALTLYKKTGFYVQVAYEYYRIKANEVL